MEYYDSLILSLIITGMFTMVVSSFLRQKWARVLMRITYLIEVFAFTLAGFIAETEGIEGGKIFGFSAGIVVSILLGIGNASSRRHSQRARNKLIKMGFTWKWLDIIPDDE